MKTNQRSQPGRWFCFVTFTNASAFQVCSSGGAIADSGNIKRDRMTKRTKYGKCRGEAFGRQLIGIAN